MLSENAVVFVTGGAGFIGSTLVRYLLAHTQVHVVNIDKLTYAGQLSSLPDIADHPRYTFSRTDITERGALDALFRQHQPDAIMHLAAESHVDRGIDGPAAFVHSNIVGTFTLLDATRTYWQALPASRQTTFRFLQVSTDEVFGDLKTGAAPFTEASAYHPSSPYSASKASADHLVQAWARTYGLPTLISHSSNNYGPYQFPEKLIPLTVIRALTGQNLPIYGSGLHIRDWLHVDDHVRALWAIVNHGQTDKSYAVSAGNEQRNLNVVLAVCRILDELQPPPSNPCTPQLRHYSELITHVADRPGHDARYALNADALQRELGWQPQCDFAHGLHHTVQWYLDHRDWWEPILHRNHPTERRGLPS